MPQDIFGDVTRPPKGLGSQAWYTVPLSIVVHALAVAVVVIVPLMAADVIPTPRSVLTATVSPPPAPDPPRELTPRRAAPSTTTAATRAIATGPVAPSEPPDTIGDEIAGPPVLPGANVGPPVADVPSGSEGGSNGVRIPDLPTPPVVKPVRPGGLVKYPAKVRDVRPHYPQIAIDGKVQGMVIIEAVIGIDGRVKDAKILRSIALLDRPALEAVQQWRFTPTLLNGVPVPVIITVTVDFKLH